MSLKKKIGIGVAVLVILGIAIDGGMRVREERKLQEELDSKSSEGTEEEVEPVSENDLEQLALIDEFGEPPQGFVWRVDGSLVAVGNSELTAEEVGFAYLRSLSILDFSTVEKYSRDSVVASSYKRFYSPDLNQNSGVGFEREVYKEVLTRLKTEELNDMAIFADGQTILTFEVETLNLSEMDFWDDYKDEIFKHLYKYYENESDSRKAVNYIHEYILEVYTSEEAPVKTFNVDLVLENSGSGWLVSNDNDINNLATFTTSNTVVNFILDEYSDWVRSNYN